MGELMNISWGMCGMRSAIAASGRFCHGKTRKNTEIFRALKCHSVAFNHPRWFLKAFVANSIGAVTYSKTN